MKKVLSIFIILAVIFLFSASSFAQNLAKIVDLKGEVLVKEEITASWAKAKLNMYLNKDAQIKTGKNSLCTLAFDEELKNVLTIKENSEIKLESIKPGRVFLPEGRVFTLIDEIKKVEKFEIRTPTAIAGSRGTGWSVRALQNRITQVRCYKNPVYVQGFDPQGNLTGETDLKDGTGLDVDPEGNLGEVFMLTSSDFSEWQEFSDYLGSLQGQETEPGEDNPQNLFNEGQETQSDANYEQRRQEEEQGREEEQGEEGEGGRGGYEPPGGGGY